MKLSRGITSVSDQKFSWLMRLGVMVLAIGVATFGFIYYQDQHVNAGPSLVDKQTQVSEAAVKKAPNNIAARLGLAQVYRSGKRLDDALTQYDVILTAEGKNRSALLGRGAVLFEKGDFTAAAVTYHKITAVASTAEFATADPQLEEAHYFLGSIALKQGKTKEAIKELQAALTINRADSDALYLYGVALLKNGSTQPAVDSFKEALQFVPTGWCEPYSQLALAQKKLGRAPEATYAGAMADFCLKKPAAATAQLKTLLKGPEAVDAMMGLALIAETESHNTEAISWYKKVLAVDPKNGPANAAIVRLAPVPTSSSTTQGPSS
jgi:tetratricopeptide (TPR) repeat protein